MKHNVFTDPPPKCPPNYCPPAKLGCFGNSCRIGFFGPLKCPIGRCQCYEDAIISDLKSKGIVMVKVIRTKFVHWANETIQDVARILEALIKICSLQMIDPKGKIWEFGFKLGIWLFYRKNNAL